MRDLAKLRAPPMSARHSISRREFLNGLIVSFALPLPLASAKSSQQAQLPIAHKTVPFSPEKTLAAIKAT